MFFFFLVFFYFFIFFFFFFFFLFSPVLCILEVILIICIADIHLFTRRRKKGVIIMSGTFIYLVMENLRSVKDILPYPASFSSFSPTVCFRHQGLLSITIIAKMIAATTFIICLYLEKHFLRYLFEKKTF